MKKILLVAALLLLSACSKDAGPVPEDEFMIVAHRGASAYLPENTLESFALAEEMDADYIELDVHLTKDNELVILHDKDVDDTTNATGDVLSFTLAELKQLSADFSEEEGKTTVSGTLEHFEIPTLREVLDEFSSKLRFVIELKDPARYIGIEQMLVDLMAEYELIGWDENHYAHTVIHSFNEPALKKVHEINAEIPLLQLLSFDEDEEAKLTEKEIEELKTYATGVGVSYESITPAFIKKMQDNDLIVHVYTVNEAKIAKEMKALGVNGIHTDKPDVMEE